MAYFGKFYLDKEKDLIVTLFQDGEVLSYVLSTPNHSSGNLIRNLARITNLPLSTDENGLLVIRGTVPCYINADNQTIYTFRLNDTKVANIFPDGRIERKATIPAIAKTLMSQTKDYGLDFKQTLVKTYIMSDVKFRTDLHTHMNANLTPDLLIALGIFHEIRYPLYYVKKMGLVLSEKQEAAVLRERRRVAKIYAGSDLQGKYLERKIDDNTYLNFADLMLHDPEHVSENLPKIRASLAVLKDGQAVFTNLEKVYLYRYVFTKGTASETHFDVFRKGLVEALPDADIKNALLQMKKDRSHPVFGKNTLYQDLLLWIARTYKSKGITYAEISDTTLVKPDGAPKMLKEAHAVLPAITKETGVTLRFLAAIRRIPLTIVKDQIVDDYAVENLRVLKAVSHDPYVAGSDIVGEEINDIRELQPLISELVKIAAEEPTFVIRIHAGENDALKDNVAHAIRCVREALAPGQTMPHLRIGHGLYTPNLRSEKGRQLIRDIQEAHAVLEFQITSNVRLNNLSTLSKHPLKQYLHAGILSVQGTDGGALYGTDSIDEQLSLERMLNLTHEELLRMKKSEEHVLSVSMEAFREKQERFLTEAGASTDVQAFYEERIRALQTSYRPVLHKAAHKLDAETVFRTLIRPLPDGKLPVVIAGGSYNNDRRVTRVSEDSMKMIDALLSSLDPEKVFFVIGHRLSGQEKYLVEQNARRFEVFSFVPTKIAHAEAGKLLRANVGIRVSIEESGMGIYKSVSYEIFKRRKSVLIAFDGNIAAANLIQEAKNGRKDARIFVSAHSRGLKEKARSLQGYARVFTDGEDAAALVREACE